MFFLKFFVDVAMGCPRKIQRLSIASAAGRAMSTSSRDRIESMIDQERSTTYKCKYHEAEIPDPQRLVDLAREIGGYTLDKDAIRAPVILFSETGHCATDVITFTLGTELRRGVIAPTKREKQRLLASMLGAEETGSVPYSVVMVGMSSVECLLMFPMNVSDLFCPIRPSYRRLLIALYQQGHIQRFDDDTLYTFKVPLVKSSGCITKSQSFVTKLLFKGLFESVSRLNHPVVWGRLFRNRSRRRRAETTRDPVAVI